LCDPADAAYLPANSRTIVRPDKNSQRREAWLSERLGQQVFIENKPGAGNNIGTEAALHSPPDGYTLLLTNPANAINTTLYPKLSFNFLRDIAPVAGIMRVPNVMEVHPSVPAKTVAEFIAYAKANPGKINWATSGATTPSTGPANRSSGSSTPGARSTRVTRTCRNAWRLRRNRYRT
jgi:hypothetical protein